MKKRHMLVMWHAWQCDTAINVTPVTIEKNTKSLQKFLGRKFLAKNLGEYDWWTNQKSIFLENVSLAIGIAIGRFWNFGRRRCRRSQKEYIWCIYKESFLDSHSPISRHSDWLTKSPMRIELWKLNNERKLKKVQKRILLQCWNFMHHGAGE